jgi:putative SOS response-associated peptidase YedK
MCGRFNLLATPQLVKETFDLLELPVFQTSYNITPGQTVLAIVPVNDPNQGDDGLQAVQLLWGLIPSWSKDPKISHSLINARAETLSEKPSFRSAFQKRRTLIPASGFIEWAQTDQGKQAYHITRSDRQVFAFAGLWEHWQQGEETVNSCTIITTAANTKIQNIHSRMPVIVAPNDYQHWLQPHQPKESLLALLANDSAYDKMDVIPVSSFVNNPRHNGPECIKPVSLA